jgi:phospholipase C
MPGKNEADVARLRQLKHIVVLMMENRSFDHMLGFLPLEGMAGVDGLKGDEFNFGPGDKKVTVQAFDAERTQIQRQGEALEKRLDPDHSVNGVKKQLGAGYGSPEHNGGFVQSFVESRKAADGVDDSLWMVPMGYYTSKDVPVYDHLARQFCVCDRWFASIPGDTWPNRLYSVTGTEGPSVPKNDPVWQQIANLPGAGQLRSAPIFDQKAFTRQLRPEQWRWYSHDPGTLRLIDSKYRQVAKLMRDNFAFFDRRKIDWKTELLSEPIVRGGSFLDDVAQGTLPQVSWIDPNFVDVQVLETSSNDDHPPSDIRAGQAFVFDVYDALRRSRDWQDTMLIVTYDEHGGFFDHVPPPPLPEGDPAPHKTYGVRVPALIAGPRVDRQVLHGPEPVQGEPVPAQFDHTSLIKTILLAFADDPVAAIAAMPPRVHGAPNLGGVLLEQPRDDVDDPRNVRDLMEAWRTEARRRRTTQPVTPDGSTERSAAPDGAGHPVVLTDFQVEMQASAIVMKAMGIEV